MLECDVEECFPFSSVGGVKRPAEGSKEEPSEKKNLPVVAKTFVAKAAENRLASAPTAQTRGAGAAAQVRSRYAHTFLSFIGCLGKEEEGKVSTFVCMILLCWDVKYRQFRGIAAS